jgi:hypothetical protein
MFEFPSSLHLCCFQYSISMRYKDCIPTIEGSVVCFQLMSFLSSNVMDLHGHRSYISTAQR